MGRKVVAGEDLSACLLIFAEACFILDGMTTKLIVNADDFGFSAGVTDGIIHAHEAGILTSTTLMTTMPDARRAIELARRTPTLGVGIHLCLTQGTPLGGFEGPLFTHTGEFPRRVWRLLLRIGRDQAVLRHIRREWEAQINSALSQGLYLSHLDSHKHIHHWPPLADIALDLARQFGIRNIRCARERPIAGIPRPSAGYRVLSRLADKLAVKIQDAGLQTSDWFFGLASTGGFSAEVWRTLLSNLPSGIGEVMVHPGQPDGLSSSQTRLLAERQLELDALCDPGVKTLAHNADISLIHYG